MPPHSEPPELDILTWFLLHEKQPFGKWLLEWRWLVFFQLFKSFSDIGNYSSNCILALLEARTQTAFIP